MPSLHVRQASHVHVKPLLFQQVLAETEWRRSRRTRTGAL